MEHADAQQIKVGAPISLSLDELETGDLPLDLRCTPGFGEGSLHGWQFFLQSLNPRVAVLGRGSLSLFLAKGAGLRFSVHGSAA